MIRFPPMPPRLPAALLALLLVLDLPARAAGGAPRVFVTVPPVHSLVAAVMDGVASPYLLLGGGASPHHGALRPSQRKALQDADLVVWVGPTLETFLARPLQSLGAGQRLLTLMETPGMRLLPLREGGEFAHHGSHGHGDHAHEGQGAEHARGRDPHLWLDPDNARRIVEESAAALSAMDPGNASRYRDNAARQQARIRALDARLARQLAPVRHVPYLVFHDAYQAFEARYGLAAVGSVTVDPGRAPGARRISALRESVRAARVQCVFTEPQFTPRLVRTVAEGTGVRLGVLDPMGQGLAPGPGAWSRTMEAIARSLVQCLGGG